MKDDIVIVGAGAHAGRGIQRRFSATCRPMSWARPPSWRRSKRAGVEKSAGHRSHHGADPHRGAGPEPGPPGLDRGRHSGRDPVMGRQHALLADRAFAPSRSAYQAIMNGDSEIVVAGGQESMSMHRTPASCATA